MGSNGRQLQLNLDRQKEYQRQQERLKAMANTTDKVKPISADLMIENLLRDTTRMAQQNKRPDPVGNELPTWLQCESPMVPAEYKYFWSLVQANTDIADTQKVSQLLLTSGLHIDILGFIWNLANKAIPGHLTKQEFFIMLALISLAQCGSPYNNLGILRLIPAPIIPVLQDSAFKMESQQHQTNVKSDCFQMNCNYNIQNMPQPQTINLSQEGKEQKILSSINDGKKVSALNFNVIDGRKGAPVTVEMFKTEADTGRGKSMSPTNSSLALACDSYSSSNFPCIGSSPSAELEDDFTDFQSVPVESSTIQKNVKPVELNDEFSDFQSASVDKMNDVDSFETVVISQKREIPKIPLPKNLMGKFTNLKSNLLKISPESERKLKVLSPKESLSSLPESKISSTNKVSTSLSVLGGSHGIGSRLANHSLGAKPTRAKLHKHQKPKPAPSHSVVSSNDDEIIFGVNTKTLVESHIPKCCKKKTTILLKETKIADDGVVTEITETDKSSAIQSEAAVCSGENTRQIEIPMLGTFNETVLPTQVRLQPSAADLISVEEDKYSALRDLEVDKQTSGQPPTESEEVNDDFGDFLSASIPPPTMESLTAVQNVPKQTMNLIVDNDDLANWGDWNFSVETKNPEVGQVAVSSHSSDITNAKDQSGFEVETLTSKTINLLNAEEQMPQTMSSKVQEEDFFKDNLAILDFSLQPPKMDGFPENADISQQSDLNLLSLTSNQEMSDGPEKKWDFLEAETKNGAEGNLLRHDSLPSLILTVTREEETDQETIRKKCLDSCLVIIREGVEIFDRIDKKSVLEEVFASPKTKDYLNGLGIAYQITKRINQNYAESTSEQENFNRLWEKLEKLCQDYNVQINADVDSIPEGRNNCKICLGCLGDDCIENEGQNYHLSCANLWVNCIDGTLPCPT